MPPTIGICHQVTPSNKFYSPHAWTVMEPRFCLVTSPRPSPVTVSESLRTVKNEKMGKVALMVKEVGKMALRTTRKRKIITRYFFSFPIMTVVLNPVKKR